MRYTIEGGDRLRLDIAEGPLVHLGKIVFAGHRQVPEERLFDYAVGPTRERYSKAQSLLPFVSADVEEGADLVQRFYVSEGFVECTIDKPQYQYVRPDLVDVRIVVHEGQQYFFGNINFVGPTIYGGSVARADARFAQAALHRGASGRYPAAVAVLLQNARLLRGESRCGRRPDARRPRAGASAGDARARRGLLLRRRDGERHAETAAELSRKTFPQVPRQTVQPRSDGQEVPRADAHEPLSTFSRSIRRRSTATGCGSTSTSRKRSRRSLAFQSATAPSTARSSAPRMRIAISLATAGRSRPRSSIRSAATKASSPSRIPTSSTPIMPSRCGSRR